MLFYDTGWMVGSFENEYELYSLSSFKWRKIIFLTLQGKNNEKELRQNIRSEEYTWNNNRNNMQTPTNAPSGIHMCSS